MLLLNALTVEFFNFSFEMLVLFLLLAFIASGFAEFDLLLFKADDFSKLDFFVELSFVVFLLNSSFAEFDLLLFKADDFGKLDFFVELSFVVFLLISSFLNLFFEN